MTVTQSTHHMYLRRSPTHHNSIPISPHLLSFNSDCCVHALRDFFNVYFLSKERREQRQHQKHTFLAASNERTCCSEEGPVGGVEKSRKYIQKIIIEIHVFSRLVQWCGTHLRLTYGPHCDCDLKISWVRLLLIFLLIFFLFCWFSFTPFSKLKFSRNLCPFFHRALFKIC